MGSLSALSRTSSTSESSCRRSRTRSERTAAGLCDLLRGLSASTGGSGTRHDLYLHAVREDSHAHLWYHIEDGQIGSGGV